MQLLYQKNLTYSEKSKLVSTKFFKISQKSVQKSKNFELYSTKITQMQRRYQKNLHNPENRSWFQQNFYNFEKNLSSNFWMFVQIFVKF